MSNSLERVLAAGQLSAMYCEGSLRYIRFAGNEVLRSVYFALRDRDWRTIPPHILREEISVSAEGFLVSFDAVHSDGPIEFCWTGRIRGLANRIEFSADGEARSRFLKNRIGLCVLHPGRACAGKTARITHTDGSVRQAEFPREVSPHQIFLDVQAITHQPRPDLETTVTFEGEDFETEDQRNWTDGSFKTYSTPLRKPFPEQVQPGWHVRHRVTCEIKESVVVTARPGTRFAWPQIGTGTSDGEADLHSLGMRHVRVDLHGGDHYRIAQAARFGLPLEVAIHTSKLEELQSARKAVLAAGAEVSRWIVYGLKASEARTVLPGDVGSGTDANFAELNRNRHLVADASFAAFSMNPQVHGSDERTIVETLEGQYDAVVSALGFANRVAVSPVTLLPRFNAVATSSVIALQAAVEPSTDSRQRSPFAAAWTLGSLSNLVRAGASSITYFEAAGPRGIAGTPVAALFTSMAAFGPEYAFACEISDPLAVVALGLGRGEAKQVIVANLKGSSTTLKLASEQDGVVLTCTCAPYEMRSFAAGDSKQIA